MATNGEKSQGLRMPTDTFSRLRSDHEQFLETYEKPTQIYRFLRARHSLKPLFLHRNLSYMHHRSTRRTRRRKSKLKVNDLINYTQDEKPDPALEIRSDNQLNILFTGLEKGVDFQGLLATASSEPTNQEPSPRSHDSCPMEVEVLLCRFSQRSAEASLVTSTSYPCTYTSLGKFKLQCKESQEPNATVNGSAQSLTIPESQLLWKGKEDSVIGAQMLIFRASRCTRGVERTIAKKKSRKLFPSVAIELNKLNHAEIAKAKQQVQSQVSSVSENYRPSNKSTGETSSTSTSCPPSRPSFQQSSSQVHPGGTSPVSTEPSPMCNGIHPPPTALSPGVAQRRAKTKAKKEKKDVGVMTDLSLGTAVINNLVPPLKRTSVSPLSLQNGKQDQEPSLAHRKGFSDKCTSPIFPRLVLKNGLGNINGLSPRNGYPDLGEIELQAAMSKFPSSAQAVRNSRRAQWEATMGDNDVTSGDEGLIVSIPRSVLVPSRSSSMSSVSSDCLGFSRRGFYRGPRRSEIQLLLDGDKPRGQRITAEEIPVFVAEDVSSRTTRRSKGPWQQSSTRKITPVEHFNYPLSPSSPKKTTGDHIHLENRKRVHSDSDSVSSPPPSKQPRIETETLPPSQSLAHAQQQQQTQPSSHPAPKLPQQALKLPSQQSQPPTAPMTTSVAGTIAETDEKMMQIKTSAVEDTSLVEHSNPDHGLTDEVFNAELTVFDSRGSCLLNDGEYSILMQQCPKKEGDSPGLLTFAPLKWNSIFGDAGQEKTEEKESLNLMLHFSLSWSNGPPHHRLITELDTALSLKKLREAYFPRTSSPLPSPSLPISLPSLPPPLSPPSLPTLLLPPPISAEPEPMMEGDGSSSGASTRDQEDPTLPSSTTYSPPPPPSSHKRVIFNFLYNNNSLQQTESREGFLCPWCFLACGRLYNLLKHMSLCHPRFFFTYSQMEGNTVIDVHVNKLYDAGSSSIDRDPGERNNLTLLQRRKGPTKCLPRTAVLVERHAEVDEEDLSEFLNDGSWKRGYNIDRMYFHSRSCLPMLGEEMDLDSETEGDTLAWQKICSQKMIEEFTDVNRGEKELMKLWNLFALDNGLIADKQIPNACVKFATEKQGELLEKGIGRNFMTHLIALCDFGLISPAVIRTCMSIVLTAS